MHQSDGIYQVHSHTLHTQTHKHRSVSISLFAFTPFSRLSVCVCANHLGLLWGCHCADGSGLVLFNESQRFAVQQTFELAFFPVLFFLFPLSFSLILSFYLVLFPSTILWTPWTETVATLSAQTNEGYTLGMYVLNCSPSTQALHLLFPWRLYPMKINRHFGRVSNLYLFILKKRWMASLLLHPNLSDCNDRHGNPCWFNLPDPLYEFRRLLCLSLIPPFCSKTWSLLTC